VKTVSQSKMFRLMRTLFFNANWVLTMIAVLCCATCMFLINADILGRYLFLRPVPGTLELSEIFLCIMIYLPLAYLGMRGEHIRIEILYSRLPAKLRSGFDFLIKVLGFFFFAIMTRQTFLDGLHSYLIKQSTWGILPIKVWIPKLFIIVGCLSFSLHFFGSLFGDLLNLFHVKPKRLS